MEKTRQENENIGKGEIFFFCNKKTTAYYRVSTFNFQKIIYWVECLKKQNHKWDCTETNQFLTPLILFSVYKNFRGVPW